MILLLLGPGIVAGAVAATAMLWAGAGVAGALVAYSLGGMVGMAAGAALLLRCDGLGDGDPNAGDEAGCFARETLAGSRSA